MIGKVDPITLNTYPDLTTYPDDGYPRILGVGNGAAMFSKSSSVPTATVEVYAPLSGTAWDFVLSCPGVTTTTTTTIIT